MATFKSAFFIMLGGLAPTVKAGPIPDERQEIIQVYIEDEITTSFAVHSIDIPTGKTTDTYQTPDKIPGLLAINSPGTKPADESTGSISKFFKLAFSLGRTKQIIKKDDRTKINYPQVWPYRTNVRLDMAYPNDFLDRGTGALIGPHHVLTAGHCIYRHDCGGWPKKITITIYTPDGTKKILNAKILATVAGWKINKDESFDFGLITLDADIGKETGWLGLAAINDDDKLKNTTINISGYPIPKGDQMWTHFEKIKKIYPEWFTYYVDTEPGQSGSCAWGNMAGAEGIKVFGIHTTGSDSGNSATRISNWKYELLTSWLSKF